MQWQKPLGYCVLHGEIHWQEFEYKGCWSCYHFAESEDFPFVDVSKASEIIGVSKSTIRRWIRKKKLKAYLFRKWRRTFSPAPKKYFIEKESIDHLLKDFKTRKF
jgi:excisionase family DNA binding protein